MEACGCDRTPHITKYDLAPNVHTDLYFLQDSRVRFLVQVWYVNDAQGFNVICFIICSRFSIQLKVIFTLFYIWQLLLVVPLLESCSLHDKIEVPWFIDLEDCLILWLTH